MSVLRNEYHVSSRIPQRNAARSGEDSARVRVLVTGGTGLIGSRLVARLLSAGAAVSVFDIKTPPDLQAKLPKVQFVEGDIADQHALQESACGVDAIVHLAYMMSEASSADPLRASAVNVLGAANVFEAARIAGVPRVVTASSISVFGADNEYPPEDLPLRDDASQLGAKGIAIYAAGKIYMEALAGHYTREWGLEIVGIRPGVVYGGERLSGGTAFVAQFIAKAKRAEPFEIPNGAVRTPLVHVDDVAAALAVLVTADSSAFARRRFFNLAGDGCSFAELAAVLRSVFSVAAITVHDGPEEGLLGMASRISDAAIETEIGFHRTYTPLRRGIEAEAAASMGAV